MNKIKTLMIIDDNRVDQMLYERIAKRSGLVENLLPFLMAQEALDYLKSKKAPQPDLILLDINMPRMDGFEFLNQATQTLGDSFCPVIVMLTTSIDPRDEARVRGIPAVKRFYNKPLTLELLRAIAQLLNDESRDVAASA